MTGLRMDKWLWAARFFKTRALTRAACEMGRIESNGVRAKASREVKLGDRLRIINDAGEFHVGVLALSAMRGPAAVAHAMYEENEESRAARAKLAEEYRLARERGDLDPGRPSKRDRRLINRMRGRVHRFGS
jgi:ribosome-associated heat shock protein Hsp15